MFKKKKRETKEIIMMLVLKQRVKLDEFDKGE